MALQAQQRGAQHIQLPATRSYSMISHALSYLTQLVARISGMFELVGQNGCVLNEIVAASAIRYGFVKCGGDRSIGMLE